MNESRNRSLDGIRGLAIALVIIHHAFQDTVGQPSYLHLGGAIWYLASSAWIGVDLFFALSGYLITRILLNSRGQSGYFRTFYMRRFLRVFPIYYAFLAALFLVSLLTPAIRPTLEFKWNVLYAANFLAALSHRPWRAVVHLWSLSVEEQFYLLWPALIFVMPRRRACESIAVIFCGFLVIRQFAVGLSGLTVYALFHLDGLILGAALAAFQNQHPVARTAQRLAWAVFAVSTVALLMQAAMYRGLIWQKWTGTSYLNYALVAVWSVSLIAASMYSDRSAPMNRLLSARVLIELGKYSYAMYLLHLPFDEGFRKLGIHPSGALATVPYTIVLTLVTFGSALLTWKLIEERFIRLKDRWFGYSGVPKEHSACPAFARAERFTD